MLEVQTLPRSLTGMACLLMPSHYTQWTSSFQVSWFAGMRLARPGRTGLCSWAASSTCARIHPRKKASSTSCRPTVSAFRRPMEGMLHGTAFRHLMQSHPIAQLPCGRGQIAGAHAGRPK